MKVQPMLGEALAQADLGIRKQPLAKFDADGRIQVYVYLQDVSEASISGLKTLGMSIDLVNEELGVVQGWLPAKSLDTLAADEAVKKITLPGYPKLRQGSVTSEGLGIMLVNGTHASGARGQGIKIGAISDGVDHRADAQATGDLPATIQIDPTRPGVGDAGTALLEIVHDVAPEATLAFSGPETSLEFIASVNYLANTANCDVVFDDMGFYDEPFFEDGPVASAVQTAAGNVTYVTAAGNDNGMHYQAQYVDVNPGSTAWPNNLHLFGGASDVSQQVVVDGGTSVIVLLQWNNRFGQSADDYDLYLYDDGLTTDVAASTARQNGNDDPYEALFYTNTKSTPVTLNILINRYSGSARTLELFVWNATSLQFATSADAIFGHAALPNVLSVGAINAAVPTLIAPYSSNGPSTLTFPAPGGVRQTPSVTAIDGISITGAGNYPTTFHGSSAAAAHAAGIAALTMNGHPTFTPAQIITQMKNTATDLGVPNYDNIYGAGLLNAQASTGLPDTDVQHWVVFR